jgi:hypothetical protein
VYIWECSKDERICCKEKVSATRLRLVPEDGSGCFSVLTTQPLSFLSFFLSFFLLLFSFGDTFSTEASD